MLSDLIVNNWGDNLVFFLCRWFYYYVKFFFYDEIGWFKLGFFLRLIKLLLIWRILVIVKRVIYKKIEKNNFILKRVLKI